MADVVGSGYSFGVVAREFTVDGNLRIIGKAYLRNTYLRTVERPRTHDPKSLCDFVKRGIVPQETQGAGEGNRGCADVAP